MKRTLLICLLLCASSLWAQTFKVGDTVRVITGISCVNVRSQLTSPNPPPIGCKVPGTYGVIRSDTAMWGTQPYYRVTYSDGLTGWSAGIYLQFVASPITVPSEPIPIGTITVTPVAPGGGPVTVSWTAKGDTLTEISGVTAAGHSGSIVVPVSGATTFTLTVSGPGGRSTYNASTSSGVPPPLPFDLRRMLDSAYNVGIGVGVARVGVQKVDIWLDNGKLITK